MINVYGIYDGRQSFSEDFFPLECIKYERVIIEGVLYFTINGFEIWGRLEGWIGLKFFSIRSNSLGMYMWNS